MKLNLSLSRSWRALELVEWVDSLPGPMPWGTERNAWWVSEDSGLGNRKDGTQMLKMCTFNRTIQELLQWVM